MSQSLNSTLQSIIPPEHRWKMDLFKHWDEIIGDLGKKVIIQEIKDSVLILAVSHPVWAQELFLLIPILKQKINSYLVNDPIKAIRLRIKNFQPRVLQRKVITSVIHQKIQVTVSWQEEKLLNKIVDCELRKALEDFLLRCKSQEKEKV